VRQLWEALTIIEPPLAQAAARAHTAEDLIAIQAAVAAYVAGAAVASRAAHCSAEVFRAIGRATHNPVLGLAQEPLLQLLEPSLRVMIDKVPQARTRIATAHRHLLEALASRDEDGAHSWMARHVRDFRKGYELAGIDLEVRVTPRAAAAASAA
jgi:GntR family transcriptional repressor for pyruvate dehydrogenase complex